VRVAKTPPLELGAVIFLFDDCASYGKPFEPDKE
jgi:hypothetical protein